MKLLPVVEAIRAAWCSPLAVVEAVVNPRRWQLRRSCSVSSGDRRVLVQYDPQLSTEHRNCRCSLMELEEHPYAAKDHKTQEKPSPPPPPNVGHRYHNQFRCRTMCALRRDRGGKEEEAAQLRRSWSAFGGDGGVSLAIKLHGILRGVSRTGPIKAEAVAPTLTLALRV
ncbi:hypothetical protein B296_00054200 [Ensete ventricosum]|uniref:Uncharacterized protein n=1 Tax=Ensete ventricosum TaxID=4639 RepID=A0A426Y5M4_ENSVE|nr:hypothetical protein B296_00054200 [Ensete ventricosum]